MENSSSIHTSGDGLDDSKHENSGMIPAADHSKSNADQRKRKLDDIETGVSKKPKIESPSLGLSLLQTYDEDIQEDSPKPDSVIASDDNSLSRDATSKLNF